MPQTRTRFTCSDDVEIHVQNAYITNILNNNQQGNHVLFAERIGEGYIESEGRSIRLSAKFTYNGRAGRVVVEFNAGCHNAAQIGEKFPDNCVYSFTPYRSGDKKTHRATRRDSKADATSSNAEATSSNAEATRSDAEAARRDTGAPRSRR